MAIVIPGKRPSDRIGRSCVLRKKVVRGRKSGIASLMLTSLVDMFTIIVIFLLQNFSASGEILYMSKDIKLPHVAHGIELERGPVISVSPDAITFDGRLVAKTQELGKSASLAVPELIEALRAERRRYEQLHAADPSRPFRGLVNVQADSRIPFNVVKRVLFSCNQSGFSSIEFAGLLKTDPSGKQVAVNVGH